MAELHAYFRCWSAKATISRSRSTSGNASTTRRCPWPSAGVPARCLSVPAATGASYTFTALHAATPKTYVWLLTKILYLQAPTQPQHQLQQQYLQAQTHMQQQGQYRQQQQQVHASTQPGMLQGIRPQQAPRPAAQQYSMQQQQQHQLQQQQQQPLQQQAASGAVSRQVCFRAAPAFLQLITL